MLEKLVLISSYKEMTETALKDFDSNSTNI